MIQIYQKLGFTDIVLAENLDLADNIAMTELFHLIIAV